MNNETLFAPLLDLLLKSAALILFGASLLATLRKTSAANRHAVSAAIFTALLLLPITKLISPRWSLVLEGKPGTAVSVRLPLIATAQATGQHPDEPSAAVSAKPAKRAPLVIPWKTLVLSVWLGGAALLLVRRALIALRLRAVVQRSDAIEDVRLAAKVGELVETSGIRAEVRESALCRVPLVAGVMHPVVLLPMDAKDWSPSLISSALRHELGHIRRRDCITRLLADAVCAFYWLNPMVWLAARQMRLAQKQACDDLVLTSGACADEYAGHLVDVVRAMQGDRFTTRHALAMAQPSTLETRVLAIMDATRDRSPRSIRGALAGFTFVAASLALCTAAQLRGADGKKPVAAGDPLTPRAEVLIEAKFVEISGEPAELLDALKLPAKKSGDACSAVLTSEEMDAVLKALNSKKGVDLLSAPRVTTRSKQRAVVEVVREFRYPSEWDKDAKTGKMTPTAFEKRDVGVTFDATPEVNADGSINFVMTPQIVEFEGYVPFNETAENAAGKKADGPGDRKPAHGNPGKTIVKPGTSLPPKERLFALPDTKGLPNDAIWQPIFHTRKITTEMTVWPGQTIVLGGMDREDVQTVEDKNPKTGRVRKTEQHIKRRLIVLVTASIVNLAAAQDAGGKKTVPAEAAQPGVQNGGEAMLTREWKVSPGFFQPGKAGDSGKSAVQDSLEKKGITFGEGATVIYNSERSSIVVRNTRAQLDLVERVIVDHVNTEKAPARLEIQSDSTTFDRTSGTLKASGNVRIETADAVIRADAVEVTPKKAAASALAAEGNAKAAAQWQLPKVELSGATVRECVDFLIAKSKGIDPNGKGANILLRNPEKFDDARITLSLSNVPLVEALKYVAGLGNGELVTEEFAFVIQPAGAGGKAVAPNPLEEKGAAQPPGIPALPKEAGSLLKKAGAIIFPKIELREATLSEAVEFLRVKARELDPDRKGVNLILQPRANGEDPSITLSLTNVPLTEAVRYIAALAGCEIVADEFAFTLRPAAK